MAELRVYRELEDYVGYDDAPVEMYDKYEADKTIAWNKYKRCLAMVQVLEHVCPMTNRKAKWRDKWRKRWLAIAKNFEEAWEVLK